MDTDLWRHLWEQSWNDGKCGINKTFAKLQKKKKEKKTITPRFTDTSLERFSYDLDKERANKTETTNERK